ncbi:PIG-L deacetylase family protein [Gimesia chilikensis]|uniref:GlcNAc-PI de-N-acetylase n=1 Tax=Gimesia chilikensis TaxID=2605989 RepID=A0A517PUY4_9PLAN|nr:PIG-L family deacetylase [Gimesia chilikensis]QDT23182.1 GlcNAc-PI de-N-acetylase [Gimesia chilikensis]
MADQKTLLAIGAHFDDCAYGVPGIMLQAVAKNYRVVQLILIGDYSNWPPTKGREAEFKEGVVRIARDYGIETRYLDFASHRYDTNQETKEKVAAAIHDIKPDIALQLWEFDHHHDHTVASQLSKIALNHGGRVLNEDRFRGPRKIYHYDNGPGHTIGFEPDTFVDVTDYWEKSQEWLGRYMALQRNVEYDPAQSNGALQGKENLARYRGQTCRVKFAEALWAPRKQPVEIL